MDARLPDLLPWALRAGWVATGVIGWSAVANALDGRSAAVQVVAASGAGVVWVLAALAVAVTGVLPLTVLRVLVPLAVPAGVVTWAFGAGPVYGPLTLGAAALTTVAAFTPAIGQAWAQASAYGAEQRFPLRPPTGFAALAGLAWVLAAGGLLAGPLLLATGRWWAGVPLTLLIGVGAFAWPRWYRLAQRWLVIVPAGLVIHDPLVLAETLMLRTIDIADVQLAPAGTDAADLTGPAAGYALEIRVPAAATAIFAGSRRNPRGTAIHLTACLVAPTRPGAALAATSRQGG